MRRLLDPRILLCLAIPFLLAFAPHDGADDNGKSIGQSAPPGIGGDGPWESKNMVLLGRLDLSEIGASASNIRGNDCWGWTDSTTGKEYAICGLTNGTSFVDITDPTDPKYLGFLATQTGNASWRDMKVFANHVFIVSDGNGDHGMQVFDLTELRTVDPASPESFTNTTWYDDGTGSCHNIAINEDTGFAYLVGSQHPNAAGGLQVVDVNDPTNPTSAGEFNGDGYTHDCQVVIYNGPDADYIGQEIAFCCNEDTVTIVNVQVKGNMTQISRNAYAQDGYTHQGWLSEDHRYFYMGDELDENAQGGRTRTHVFDCLDMDAPVYKGFYSGETNAIDHNLYVKGNRLFCGNYAAGLRVLETDPNDPSVLDEIAYFDSYNANTGTNFDGVWSIYPYFASENIIINDRQGGLFIVKFSPISIDILDPLPELINPVGGAHFQVQVSDFDGTAAAGSGVLHVDTGNGFVAYPMTEVSTGIYDAVFPAIECGTELQYYVSALGTDGTEMCVPSTAPVIAYNAFSASSITTLFAEDFETDSGWTVSGDALDGQWERAVPAGGGDRADPPTDGDGSGNCFVTDNEDGNSDVDDGSTILTSATIDGSISGSQEALISYYRWYNNSGGGNPAQDIMTVEISNDDGATWSDLETVGPTGNDVSGGWIKKMFSISDFLPATTQMKLRFTVSDLGGGSVVEAGVDGVQIQVVDCPVEVTVLAQKLLTGISSGSRRNIDVSDDIYMTLDPATTSNPFKQRVDNIILSESPISDPSGLTVRVEAAFSGGAVGEVQQEVRMYNYLTKRYESIDFRDASDSEEVFTINATGDVSRFLHPVTDQLLGRVIFTSTDFQGAPFNWSVEVDQIIFIVSQ